MHTQSPMRSQSVSTERYTGTRMSTMATVVRNPEATPGPARATYQDVLDAPAHRVAEIVEGGPPHSSATRDAPCTGKLGAG